MFMSLMHTSVSTWLITFLSCPFIFIFPPILPCMHSTHLLPPCSHLIIIIIIIFILRPLFYPLSLGAGTAWHQWPLCSIQPQSYTQTSHSHLYLDHTVMHLNTEHLQWPQTFLPVHSTDTKVLVLFSLYPHAWSCLAIQGLSPYQQILTNTKDHC